MQQRPPPRPPEHRPGPPPAPVYQQQWQEPPEPEEEEVLMPDAPQAGVQNCSHCSGAAVALLFILRFYVFTISHVQVVGNRMISLKEVAQSAGLDRCLLYFIVNEEEIRQGINANRYLDFEKMEKVFPNTLILYVRSGRSERFFYPTGGGVCDGRRWDDPGEKPGSAAAPRSD